MSISFSRCAGAGCRGGTSAGNRAGGCISRAKDKTTVADVGATARGPTPQAKTGRTRSSPEHSDGACSALLRSTLSHLLWVVSEHGLSTSSACVGHPAHWRSCSLPGTASDSSGPGCQTTELHVDHSPEDMEQQGANGLRISGLTVQDRYAAVPAIVLGTEPPCGILACMLPVHSYIPRFL